MRPAAPPLVSEAVTRPERNIAQYFRVAFLSWIASWHSFFKTSALLSVVITLCYEIIGLITLLRGWFALPMLPIFESTFDAFRIYIHIGLEWAFYHWIVLSIKLIIYFGSFLLSLVTPIVPFIPNLSVPRWIKDAALISIVILRVFESAYFVLPRNKRDDARDKTTPEQKAMIKRAQGPFWGTLHYHIDKTNKQLYDISDWIIYQLQAPCRSFGWSEHHQVSLMIRKFVRELLLGIVMSGYVRLAGYLVYLPWVWRIGAPTVKSIKETFLYFCVSFVVALVTTGLWFWANSYLLTWLRTGNVGSAS